MDATKDKPGTLPAAGWEEICNVHKRIQFCPTCGIPITEETGRHQSEQDCCAAVAAALVYNLKEHERLKKVALKLLVHKIALEVSEPQGQVS